VAVRIRLLAALLCLGPLGGACQPADQRVVSTPPDHGSSRPAASPDRTIAIEMVDIAFQPSRLSVEAGQTVRLRFHNFGNDIHEAFIGDAAAQRKHERLRAARQWTSGAGDDAVEVSSGQVGELTYRFSRPGTLLIGCHERGHYATGMRITITVQP
jgi:uncharacterized cupredoxin-like copper-binding protein